MVNQSKFLGKTLSLTVILLFIGMCVQPCIATVQNNSNSIATGNTLYVGGTGEGNYTKIQDAIDDANDGDTVFVYEGVYIEKLKINKTITLLGENRDTTIINGKGSPRKWHIISIYVDNVIISNFTVRNTTSNWATIYLRGMNCKIVNNRIYSNKKYGIITYFDNNISNNLIYSNEIGIYSDLEIWGYKIYHNTIYNNTNGILFEFGTRKLLRSSNEIRWNNIYNNKFGICFKTSVNNYNTISNNIFYNNDYGIYTNLDDGTQGLFSSFKGNKIINNRIFNNRKSGIYLEVGVFSMTKFNKIERNQIYSNKESGITLYVGGVIENNIRIPRFDKICNNNITSNGDYGILIEKWCATKIENNIIRNHSELGLYLVDSYFCSVKENNFLNNKDEASFIFWRRLDGQYGLINRLIVRFRCNRWDKNYWNEPRDSPYIIKGVKGYTSSGGDFLFRDGWDVDWRPAKEPYEIQ